MADAIPRGQHVLNDAGERCRFCGKRCPDEGFSDEICKSHIIGGASSGGAAAGICQIGCSCKIFRNELEESKENGGYGLTLDDLCPAMACQHPVSSHEKRDEKRRRSGGELSESSEDSTGRQRSSAAASPAFDSFLAASDTAPALPGSQLPFAPSLHYLPLLQQPNSAAQPAILGDDKAGSRLFVRASYPLLTKLILDHRAEYVAMRSTAGGALITGNAGVGKSVFLAYLIKALRSMHAPPTIVYEQISEEACFVMRPGVANAEEYKAASASMLRDRSVVYLVDVGGTATRGPLQCAALTVVVASPHAKSKDIVQHWWTHAKAPPVWYMPCWNAAELESCRRVVCPTDLEQTADKLQGARLLPAVSAASVAHNHQRFGGIARVTLSTDDARAGWEAKLSGAIAACDLEVVAEQAGGDLDPLPESSSWVLHYVVDETTFKLSNIEFASASILDAVWQRWGTGQSNKVVRFLDSLSKNPTWSGAHGGVFEQLAHEYLQQGGSFNVQQFVNPLTKKRGDKGKRAGVASQLVLPPSPHPGGPLPDAASIASLARGQYGQPSKDNFATIDGALAPNMMFQMAVGATHDVNIDGLLAATAALPRVAADPPPRVYYVVPPQRFPTFQVGAFQSSQQTPPSAIPATVEFWVLELYPMSAAPGKRSAATAGVVSLPAATKVAPSTAGLATSPSIFCNCFDGCKKGSASRPGHCPCRAVPQQCHAGCHNAAAPASAQACGNSFK